MMRIEEQEKRRYPYWVVVVLTLVSLIALFVISDVMILLFRAALWPNPIHSDFELVVRPWLAMGLSLIGTYQINARLRRKMAGPLQRCLHCGFDNASATARFCRNCLRLRVSVFRFYSVSDWAITLIGFLFLVLILHKIIPGILRLCSITWSGRLPTVVTQYSVLLLAGLNVALRIKGEIKKQRAAFETQRVEDGTHCTCGYDLTGNESGVCPECGVAIRNGSERDTRL